METKPALKAGVRFWRSRFSNQLHIGTRHRNIPLPDQFHDVPVEGLLKLIDGKQSVTTIAKQTGLSTESISNFTTQLSSAGFVDLKKRISAIDAKSKSHNTQERIAEVIGSEAIREVQLEIESDAITINPDIQDGGAEIVARRSQFEILIFGTNRIAVTLLGALRAAGFERTSIIDRAPRNHPARMIQASDLMGGFFRNSEILQNKAHVLQSCSATNANASNVELIEAKVRNPNLIISVGAPAFDAQQRWLSEGTPHLLITFETSGELRLGPLVVPGQSPCLTCIELSEIDAGLEPRLRPYLVEVEVSVGLALLTAGAAVLEVSKLAANSSTPIVAKSFEITSEQFINPEVRSWQFHPLCGCRR